MAWRIQAVSCLTLHAGLILLHVALVVLYYARLSVQPPVLSTVQRKVLAVGSQVFVAVCCPPLDYAF